MIGANGSGKSTLIRLLAGLLTPTRGAVYFEGCLLSHIPRQHIAQRVAYVPQTNLMIFPFTALEVVLTGRSPYTSRFQFESQPDCEKALAALEMVGARHLAFRPITELSGGERQLIALARALAQEPQCLLLDEPSASLDLKHRAELIRLLRHLRDRQALSAQGISQSAWLCRRARSKPLAESRRARQLTCNQGGKKQIKTNPAALRVTRRTAFILRLFHSV